MVRTARKLSQMRKANRISLPPLKIRGKAGKGKKDRNITPRVQGYRIGIKGTPEEDIVKATMFTDEKYFDSNDHGSMREWVLPGMQPSGRVRDTWAPHVHVWGAVGHGVRFLVLLPKGRQTEDQYKKKCLIPLFQYLKRKGLENRVLQYDGDRSHDATGIRKYLKNKKVEVLEDWPPRSPELTPIENMWAIVQQRVDACGPSDAEELWKFVKQEWDAIPEETVNNLVGSFPSRLKRCIAARGAHILTKDPRKVRTTPK